MVRILVVCGAGASSTFLVHWIRRVCASRGIAAEVEAGAVELLETEVLNADVVLVGRPLHGGFLDIQAMTNAAGVPAVLLPDSRFDEGTAALALDLALGALPPSVVPGAPDTSDPTAPTPQPAPEPGRTHG